ncbi:IclR family transcriptional regulator [Citricoccus muralis]|uniref:IclR family transcriptional regulator n=1 Tax=Citricoccus muralis TaxID=169134 RepID=A0ABY8H8H8_9MICC|nr:IclR family transcriptional regulator [Citricoccus muralis]WFP17129.1 IclR family transcriptional regulator [Citricoccus muralis]
MDSNGGILARVARILKTLAHSGAGLTATEMSRATTIPVSTCHRILRALAEEDLLEIDTAYRYHPGLSLWELGTTSPRSGQIQQAALPFMRDLMHVSGFPVHLAVRDGLQAVFVEKMYPSGKVPERPHVGSHYPLHLTSVGLALLAHAPSSVQEQYLSSTLERRTNLTVTDPHQIRRTLADIRAQGFAISDRQVNETSISAAAPIKSADGRVVAALSVNTPHGVLRERTMAHAVQTTALSISRAIS